MIQWLAHLVVSIFVVNSDEDEEKYEWIFVEKKINYKKKTLLYEEIT